MLELLGSAATGLLVVSAAVALIVLASTAWTRERQKRAVRAALVRVWHLESAAEEIVRGGGSATWEHTGGPPGLWALRELLSPHRESMEPGTRVLLDLAALYGTLVRVPLAIIETAAEDLWGFRGHKPGAGVLAAGRAGDPTSDLLDLLGRFGESRSAPS